MEINSDQLDFEHYFLNLAASATDHEKTNTVSSQNPFMSISHEKEIMTSGTSVNGGCWDNWNDDKGCLKTLEREDLGFKIAFRTKSDIEIMDDGYRWRKYGKKKVKDTPYPRNYYRCSVKDCGVKKKVEREREDPRFVITTYEGKHNHISPSPSPSTANAFNISAAQPHTLQSLHQP